MIPRLMVVCLGGLAGAGAVVCCDLDEGVEFDAEGEGEGTQDAAPATETAAAEPDAPPLS